MSHYFIQHHKAWLKSMEKSLEKNTKKIMKRLGNSADIIMREFKIGPHPKTSAAVIYTDGLTDTQSVQKFIMESLLFEFKEEDSQKEDSKKETSSLLERLKERSEEHTSELQSRGHLVCRLLLEKKNKRTNQ